MNVDLCNVLEGICEGLDIFTVAGTSQNAIVYINTQSVINLRTENDGSVDINITIQYGSLNEKEFKEVERIFRTARIIIDSFRMQQRVIMREMS